MQATNIDVTFGPAAADRHSLSKAHARTLAAIYRHPIAHNLTWADVVALFHSIGTVEQTPHNDFIFGLGGAHHHVGKPHSKDITVEELLEVRRILTQAGWGADAQAGGAHTPAAPGADTADVGKADLGTAAGLDLLVTVEHHEARIFRLDINAADSLEHVIRPHDPHHFLHHLAHKDQPRERGQRAPEDADFYTRLDAALAGARSIVVVGHGAGHSNAADRLVESLRAHHPETFGRVACELVADLSSVTTPQLLVLGRRALALLPKAAA